jgi:tRNA pseudouridine38-40 synthase
MRNIKITIQYDGTDYSGWQVQKNSPTIQGHIEKAIVTVTGEEARIIGAGRTDAGVHALDQTAAFKTASLLEPGVLFRALHANLPMDIRIIACEECADDFHPRYNAKNKTYTYLICRETPYSVFLRRFSLMSTYCLDVQAMDTAAGFIIGSHDFSSFRASGCSAKNPVREIQNISVLKLESIDFMGFTFKTPVIKISMQANAFLRHMARNIVGTLMEVGRGRIAPEKMNTILESKNRDNAGPTAPARGLFLEKITY